MSRATRRLIAMTAAIALLAAGCGDDDDDVGAAADDTTTTEVAADDETTTTEAEDASEEETEEEASEEETEASEAGDAEAVEVTAVDYEFEGLPETAPAGTKLSLVNGSDAELHELVAFRLADDEERSVEELLALPEGEFDPGMPVAVLIAPPGGPVIEAVGDGTLAEAGRYAVICAIPIGADPAAYLEAAAESQGGPPDVEGGPPHFTMGMFAELEVE